MQYKLNILTADREFYSGMVDSLTFSAVDGQMCILAGHSPLVCALDIGQIKIVDDNGEHICANSDGHVEIFPEEVTVFAQSCEWPEEIDVARAKASEERAKEELERHKSRMVYEHSRITMARAMARLRVSQYKGKYNN